MGQMIQFLEMSGGANCAKAVLPVVYQGSTDFAAAGPNTGSAQVDLIPAIASGANAAYGGQIVNSGCYDLKVTLTYLQGADCDPCTTADTLTTADITVTVPKNSSFPIPDGFWSTAKAQLVDSTGAPVDLTGTGAQSVKTYSAYTPACPECAVQVP